jgi:tetratricopeptide (TPR) repeat protein
MRFRGELDRAERDASEAVDELLEAAPRWAAWGLHELGEIRRRRGDLEGAVASFQRSAGLGFDPEPGLALLRLDQGKASSARRAILGALANGGGLAREGRWLVLPAAVEIAIAAGDADLAQSAFQELDALAESLDTTAVRAAAAVAGGRVAMSESRIEDAVKDLRRGVRLWSEIDVPYEAAQAREILGRALIDLDDADAAELELMAARASFERMGAGRAARRVEALLMRAGTAPRTAVRTFMFTDIVGPRTQTNSLRTHHFARQGQPLPLARVSEVDTRMSNRRRRRMPASTTMRDSGGRSASALQYRNSRTG